MANEHTKPPPTFHTSNKSTHRHRIFTDTPAPGVQNKGVIAETPAFDPRLQRPTTFGLPRPNAVPIPAPKARGSASKRRNIASANAKRKKHGSPLAVKAPKVLERDFVMNTPRLPIREEIDVHTETEPEPTPLFEMVSPEMWGYESPPEKITDRRKLVCPNAPRKTNCHRGLRGRLQGFAQLPRFDTLPSRESFMNELAMATDSDDTDLWDDEKEDTDFILSDDSLESPGVGSWNDASAEMTSASNQRARPRRRARLVFE